MSILQETNSFSSVFRKLSLSIGFIAVSIVYAVSLRTNSSPATVATPPVVSPSQSYKEASTALLQILSQITGSTTPPPSSTTPTVVLTPAQSQPMMTPMMQKHAGLYTDGSYTGSAADAYYGTVQVKVIVKNGQLADVQFLQYPNDRSNSRYINGQAMPLLKQEAIQAQNAQVDGVSGATFTSQAFKQSLASALTLAKN